MKYEKCLTCDQLSVTCDGPNLLAMSTVELGLWCNELRKKIPGMTYDKIAAGTGISKTAVYGFLTGAHDDCSLHTAREIARYITRGKWEDNPCGNLTTSERAGYEEQIRRLEEGITWRDDRIGHLQDNYTQMTTLVANTNKRHEEQTQFLQRQLDARSDFLKRKDKAIVILSVLLGVCVLVMIAMQIWRK